jgi:hypothetical protein
LWNGQDTTYQKNKDDPGGAGKNTLRTFKSRSGHYLEFNDDGEGKKEKVTLKTKHGHYVVLDDTDGALLIEMATGDGNQYLKLDETNKKITMETKNGDMDILAKQGTVKIDAKTVDTHSSQDTTMKMDGKWDATATGNMTLKSSAQGDIESTGTMTIKGSIVNIN